MAKYRIAWMPGDGVGKDVMEAARIVLDAMGFDAEYIPAEIGWEYWCNEGNPLPDRTIEILRQTDCALFGAITSKPNVDAMKELSPHLQGQGLSYFSPIVRLRQLFNLHTNLRPCKAYPGNPLNYRDDVDLVVFRENTEGMYGGVEWFPLPEKIWAALADSEVGHPQRMQKWLERGLHNVAFSSRIVSVQGCTSICRQAFEYARKHGRKRVTLVEKPNVLRETGGLMMRCFYDVAAQYPEIQADDANIDAICMWMIKNPQNYDVLVAENMFGDIVSDLCAGLVGGLGFASAANIGDEYAVFEPTHGSAPKYDGLYKVNPMAMLLTVKLMFDWLGELDMAERLEASIAAVIREGKVGTYDVGLNNTTLEVAEEVARYASGKKDPAKAKLKSTARKASGKKAKTQARKTSKKKFAKKKTAKKKAKKKATKKKVAKKKSKKKTAAHRTAKKKRTAHKRVKRKVAKKTGAKKKGKKKRAVRR